MKHLTIGLLIMLAAIHLFSAPTALAEEKISLSTQTIELGKMIEGDVAEKTITLTNEGDILAKIANVTTS